MTNASGTVVQTLDYYPFGQRRISAGSDVSQREYIGEHFDESSSLSYLNARYYTGDRGQFLSQDPVFLEDPATQNLANPQSLNSYSYAENNPLVKKDPTGRCAEPFSAAFCGAVFYSALTYSVAQTGISAYDWYITDVKYRDVFSSQEREKSRGSFGLNAVLGVTGAAAPRVGLESLGPALNTLTTTLDVLDTTLNGQAYTVYNDPSKGLFREPRYNPTQNQQLNPNPVGSIPQKFYTPSPLPSAPGSRQPQGKTGGRDYSAIIANLEKVKSSLQELSKSLPTKRSNL